MRKMEALKLQNEQILRDLAAVANRNAKHREIIAGFKLPLATPDDVISLDQKLSKESDCQAVLVSTMVSPSLSFIGFITALGVMFEMMCNRLTT